MRRDAEQLVRIARLFAPLLRQRSAWRGDVLLAVPLVAYLVAAPWLNRTWGWKLPGWSDVAPVAAPDRPTAASAADAQLEAILQGARRDVYSFSPGAPLHARQPAWPSFAAPDGARPR